MPYIDTSSARVAAEAKAAKSLTDSALSERLRLLATDVRRFDSVQRSALLNEGASRLSTSADRGPDSS